jgi:uncharacterized protein
MPIMVAACLCVAMPERRFAPEGGESGAAGSLRGMDDDRLARRLRRLPRAEVAGIEVAVASRCSARSLGLAWLAPRQAGAGLLIPRCSSVHTFGMRFALDLVFLDERGEPLAERRHVPPRRVVRLAGAAAVLELPCREGGEFSPLGT